MALKKKAFENIVITEKNAGNQHFLLFPQCFLPIPNRSSVFKLHLFCRLQMLSIWTSLKTCRLVMSLTKGWSNWRLENTGKGRKCWIPAFSSFSTMFSKDIFPRVFLTHYHTMPHFDALKICNSGKHCEKRRNCLEQAISPFPTMFSILCGTYISL